MVARPLDVALVAMVGSRAVSLDRDAGETDHETALRLLRVFSSVHMSKGLHKPSQPPRLDPGMLQPVCTSTPLSRDPFVKRRGCLNPNRKTFGSRTDGPGAENRKLHRVAEVVQAGWKPAARKGWLQVSAHVREALVPSGACCCPAMARACDAPHHDRPLVGGATNTRWAATIVGQSTPERLPQTRNPTLSLTRAGLIWSRAPRYLPSCPEIQGFS